MTSCTLPLAVDVNEAGCSTGIHRPNWLTRQRGYSWDLDWSVHNFKAHPRPFLLVIKDKMAAQFKYRGGLRDVSETVFFQILCQQMRTRKSNMKKLIKSSGPWNPYGEGYGGPHVDNFKRLIVTTDKIVEGTHIKAARQTLSYSGRSEGEVCSRFVSNFVCKIFENEYVTTYSHIMNYMTLDSHMLLSYDFRLSYSESYEYTKLHTVIYWTVFVCLCIFHESTVAQAADLERRPTQLEVETELATPGKS